MKSIELPATISQAIYDHLKKAIEIHWGEEFVKPPEFRAKEPDLETR